MFQAEAGGANTESVSSTRSVISDKPATYDISDEQGARKNALDNRQATAVNRAGMGKKAALVLLVALALASFQLAEGQQQARMIKIGEIVFGIRPGGEIGIGRQLLRRELGRLGYVEGTNVVLRLDPQEGRLTDFEHWRMS